METNLASLVAKVGPSLPNVEANLRHDTSKKKSNEFAYNRQINHVSHKTRLS